MEPFLEDEGILFPLTHLERWQSLQLFLEEEEEKEEEGSH